ncbi:MAG TPA: hypothetical protein VED59_00155, partial [Acidimicrobiales bacterium]|nr:hypothetical protein [Acidimicrobiales bacterium]
RLAPVPGSGGWLARLPGAVVWVPGGGLAADEFLAACLAATGPIEMLGKVGSRLADPRAKSWPAFALVAERHHELVAVVYGSVEVTALHADHETKLFGGDELGSWLNRVLKDVRELRAGRKSADESLGDFHDGVR